MIVNGLGHIAVPTPGTPVLLGNVLTALGLDPEMRVARVYFTPLSGNVAKTYVGTTNMNKSSGVGVLKQLLIPPTSGFNDTFTLDSVDDGVNLIRLASLAVDADTANDKLTVSYVAG